MRYDTLKGRDVQKIKGFVFGKAGISMKRGVFTSEKQLIEETFKKIRKNY